MSYFVSRTTTLSRALKALSDEELNAFVDEIVRKAIAREANKRAGRRVGKGGSR